MFQVKTNQVFIEMLLQFENHVSSVTVKLVLFRTRLFGEQVVKTDPNLSFDLRKTFFVIFLKKTFVALFKF